MPTAIRSFELHNNGVAIDIWPQLKDPNDPDNSDKNVWDGRFDTNESTKLNISTSSLWSTFVSISSKGCESCMPIALT